jgi:hypothetical protein
VARWRRPRLIAKGDPHHDRIVAGIRRRIARLPAGSVVLTEDEAHLDLLPTLRATWTRRGHRHQVMTPGKNRRATIFGALNVTTGAWFHLWARRSAASFPNRPWTRSTPVHDPEQGPAPSCPRWTNPPGASTARR